VKGYTLGRLIICLTVLPGFFSERENC